MSSQLFSSLLSFQDYKMTLVSSAEKLFHLGYIRYLGIASSLYTYLIRSVFLCLSFVFIFRNSINAALPVTTLLEARSAGWICPLLATVTVAGVCLALTELCPLLFTVLVALASPEWKVLTRSMTYESTTTGSPVLAVFTAGKSILGFHLIYSNLRIHHLPLKTVVIEAGGDFVWYF